MKLCKPFGAQNVKHYLKSFKTTELIKITFREYGVPTHLLSYPVFWAQNRIQKHACLGSKRSGDL